MPRDRMRGARRIVARGFDWAKFTTDVEDGLNLELRNSGIGLAAMECFIGPSRLRGFAFSSKSFEPLIRADFSEDGCAGECVRASPDRRSAGGFTVREVKAGLNLELRNSGIGRAAEG